VDLSSAVPFAKDGILALGGFISLHYSTITDLCWASFLMAAAAFFCFFSTAVDGGVLCMGCFLFDYLGVGGVGHDAFDDVIYA